MPKNMQKFQGIVGRSRGMQELFQRIDQVAPIDIPVLIVGESGTGKELVATAVHNLSHRRNSPFIPVNTGAISPELIMSELFGHEKGAFTGATTKHAGKFEQAEGGTLFLDEIGTMDQATQVALLRVLETRTYQRVGGQSSIDAHIRLIAATNQDLRKAINGGVFREDLFHRFNVFPLTIPPLRDRTGDIPLLLEHFSEKYCEEFSLTKPDLTKSAIELLKSYPWPGNVREFENVVMRLIITADGNCIDDEDLPPEIRNESPGAEQGETLYAGMSLEDGERKLIQLTVKATKGNKKAASEMLGISRKALYNKLKKYSLL